MTGTGAACRGITDYKQSPEDAFEMLKLRLTPEELALINREAHVKITQKEIRGYIDQLG